MKYQACLYGKTDVSGGDWTTIASGQTRKSCLNNLATFLARQPMRHWGICNKSLVKLYSLEQAAFIETIQIL